MGKEHTREREPAVVPHCPFFTAHKAGSDPNGLTGISSLLYVPDLLDGILLAAKKKVPFYMD